MSFSMVATAISKGEEKALAATVQIMMLRAYLEAQTKFADGGNSTKVLMFPTKDTVPLSYGGLKDMLR